MTNSYLILFSLLMLVFGFKNREGIPNISGNYKVIHFVMFGSDINLTDSTLYISVEQLTVNKAILKYKSKKISTKSQKAAEIILVQDGEKISILSDKDKYLTGYWKNNTINLKNTAKNSACEIVAIK
jgi:predicted phage tail protein